MLKENLYSLHVLNDVTIIKKHLDDDPLKFKTCSELLAAVTFANRKSVEKAFKDIYGYGIKAYHVRQRLEFSKTFLKEGKSIKLVASKCLYQSQSAYCSAFKKVFGMTPTEWLKILSRETREALSQS